MIDLIKISASLLVCLHVASAALANDSIMIHGSVALAESAPEPADGDRLILKLHHPGDNVEMDPTYRIFREFSLPMAFAFGPQPEMAGYPRWPTYIMEIYTDRDGDLLTIGDGELYATSGEALPLGTTGLTLELAPVNE